MIPEAFLTIPCAIEAFCRSNCQSIRRATLIDWLLGTYDIRSVFAFARSMSPCMLILEDIDTIVTPSTRSYFFNEVDGLENNDGIFMVGYISRLCAHQYWCPFRLPVPIIWISSIQAYQNDPVVSTASTYSRCQTKWNGSSTATTGARSWSTSLRSSSPRSFASPSLASHRILALRIWRKLSLPRYSLLRAGVQRTPLAVVVMMKVTTWMTTSYG